MPSLKHSLGMLHPAASRHPKATHQWLLMGVQACRLPALKPLKRLKGLKRLKTLVQACRLPALKPALKRHRLNIPLACFIPAASRHPKATHQWLLMGVQACRLPALKPLKRFLQPAGTPRPHINGFFWASKPAVCQPLNP